MGRAGREARGDKHLSRLQAEHLDATLQAFRDRRPDIDRLVSESPHMSGSTRKYLQKYIGDFYKTIDNPRAVKARLREACL